MTPSILAVFESEVPPFFYWKNRHFCAASPAAFATHLQTFFYYIGYIGVFFVVERIVALESQKGGTRGIECPDASAQCSRLGATSSSTLAHTRSCLPHQTLVTGRWTGICIPYSSSMSSCRTSLSFSGRRRSRTSFI